MELLVAALAVLAIVDFWSILPFETPAWFNWVLSLAAAGGIAWYFDTTPVDALAYAGLGGVLRAFSIAVAKAGDLCTQVAFRQRTGRR